jgi:hypothetical protein
VLECPDHVVDGLIFFVKVILVRHEAIMPLEPLAVGPAHRIGTAEVPGVTHRAGNWVKHHEDSSGNDGCFDDGSTPPVGVFVPAEAQTLHSYQGRADVCWVEVVLGAKLLRRAIADAKISNPDRRHASGA